MDCVTSSRKKVLKVLLKHLNLFYFLIAADCGLPIIVSNTFCW